MAQQELLQYVNSYNSSCQFHLADTFNLILFAPCGGSLTPTDMPNRTQGGCRRPGPYCTYTYNDTCLDGDPCETTIVQDTLSDQFMENVAAALNNTYGLEPFVVIGK
ncbi:unnamed protein product [Rotaria sp. Silwood1]|nr:unnamed protein product [Rotaria sp. Silwood1]CAF3575269.1 unnamed protein product [Rotaria sp. Silwood1]CAF3697503.1 unnamed protein product [Rotaria sp. Silwood1]CAF4585842.1 unnamed protein product [Rotaria sp. Silwood1]